MMTVFVDFDDVIFCTKRFVAGFMQIFARNGIDEAAYYQSRTQMKKVCGLAAGYDLDAHLDIIAQSFDCNIDKLRRDMSDFMQTSSEYVHDDVREFIVHLRQVSDTQIVLVSYGVPPFQSDKITASGVLELVDDAVIGQFDKGVEVAARLSAGTAWFIDDRAEFCAQVKRAAPQVKTILMLRSDGRYNDAQTAECDFVADSLHAVEKIIHQ